MCAYPACAGMLQPGGLFTQVCWGEGAPPHVWAQPSPDLGPLLLDPTRPSQNLCSMSPTLSPLSQCQPWGKPPFSSFPRPLHQRLRQPHPLAHSRSRAGEPSLPSTQPQSPPADAAAPACSWAGQSRPRCPAHSQLLHEHMWSVRGAPGFDLATLLAVLILQWVPRALGPVSS